MASHRQSIPASAANNANSKSPAAANPRQSLGMSYFDPAYEFDCPQKVDFNDSTILTDEYDQEADQWFDMQQNGMLNESHVAGDGESVIVNDEDFHALINDENDSAYANQQPEAEQGSNSKRNSKTPASRRTSSRRQSTQPTPAPTTQSMAAPLRTVKKSPQPSPSAAAMKYESVVEADPALYNLVPVVSNTITADNLDDSTEEIAVPVKRTPARRMTRRYTPQNKDSDSDEDTQQTAAAAGNNHSGDDVVHFPVLQRVQPALATVAAPAVTHITPATAATVGKPLVKQTTGFKHQSGAIKAMSGAALGAARRVSVHNRMSKRGSTDDVMDESPQPEQAALVRPSTASSAGRLSSRLTQPTQASIARQRSLSVSRLNDEQPTARPAIGEATDRRTTRSGRGRSISGTVDEDDESDVPRYARSTASLSNKRRDRSESQRRGSVNQAAEEDNGSTTSRDRSESRGRPSLSKKQRTSMTQPVSPKFSTAARSRRSTLKSREDEILEQMARERQEVQAQAQVNARSVAAVLAPTFSSEHVLPHRSNHPLTQPKEFHLSTGRRATIRNTNTDNGSSTHRRQASGELPVVSERRPSTSHSARNTEPPQLTQPKPFSLATDRRATHSNQHIKSTEELQMDEIAQHGQFKARPVDERVLHSVGDIGVQRVAKAPVTTVEEFSFNTEKRPRKPLPMSKEEEELAEIEKHNLHKRVAASNSRRGSRAEFHLATEDRGSMKEAQFQQKLQQELERQANERQFKAQPMVVSEPLALHHTVKVTEPKPFALRSEQLHEVSKQEFETALEREQQNDRERRKFRAQPLPSTTEPNAEVWHPKPSDKPLTEVRDVALSSERRAAEREQFEHELAAKEEQRKRMQAVQEAERAAVNAEEIKALRRQMVPKAQPVNADILDHPTFVPAKSNKPLTTPATPALQTKKRAAVNTRAQR